MVQKKAPGKWKVVLAILLVCFLGAQLIRPRISHPPVTADVDAPEEIKQILRSACYDCHSNETHLLWFDKITPANWLVADHIREGRNVLNFSQWDSLNKDQRKGKLFESLNQMVFNTMPLPSYTLLHPAAKITPLQIAALRSYLSDLAGTIRPDPAKDQAGKTQYLQWIQQAGNSPRSSTDTVKPSPNGIAFMPDYRNWQALSSTERFDNGTMRVILGNDVAVRAAKAGQTHPWPDGTRFAKVAWDQVIDTTGSVHTGAFKQVEFMIRDSRKYASTDGWGWARWVKGLQLVPYGKDALFTTECMNCHEPMKKNDLVFTSPVRRPELPKEDVTQDPAFQDPMEGKVIRSSVDKYAHTMSTLYGNDKAVAFARTHTGTGYPPGSALALVTWTQKEDEHWFGATIPSALQSVERISFPGAAPVYEKLKGPSLKKATGTDAAAVAGRIRSILEGQASVMP